MVAAKSSINFYIAVMECFDPVRKKAVSATPEERVRQNIVAWLLQTIKVPSHLIEVEFGLSLIQKGNMDRVDILVPGFRAGRSLKEPWLLVECKQSCGSSLQNLEVQVNKYLRVVRPQYIMLALGSDWRFLSKDGDGMCYLSVPNLPRYPDTQSK
jgi:hypothetical protein